MRLNFDTDWFNNNKRVKVLNSPSENYLFLNVMVNFVIVNHKLTGSALHIEKNQTIYVFLFYSITPRCPYYVCSNLIMIIFSVDGHHLAFLYDRT